MEQSRDEPKDTKERKIRRDNELVDRPFKDLQISFCFLGLSAFLHLYSLCLHFHSVRFHPSFSFFLFLISCCTTVQEILILRIVNTWTLNSFSGKYFYKNEDNKSWKNISVAGALTYRTRWFQVLLLSLAGVSNFHGIWGTGRQTVNFSYWQSLFIKVQIF